MLMYFERRRSNRQRFCKYSSEVHIRQRKAEMETFVENCSELSQRSFASSYWTFAAGEVKGRTASGPGLSCRERSRLKDLLPILYAATWLKTRSCIGAPTIDAREAKPALEVASTQGRRSRKSWPFYKAGDAQCLGVKRVRARERGPGRRGEIRQRRDLRRREVHREEV